MSLLVACTYQNLISVLLARSLALTRPAERQLPVAQQLEGQHPFRNAPPRARLEVAPNPLAPAR